MRGQHSFAITSEMLKYATAACSFQVGKRASQQDRITKAEAVRKTDLEGCMTLCSTCTNGEEMDGAK